MKHKLFYIASLILVLSSCQSVKTYDMVYVNDPEMQMGSSPAKGQENYVQTIREGATPSGATKSSGGCGCN